MKHIDNFKNSILRRKAIPYLALAGAVLLAYANAFTGPFVWDDLHTISGNIFLRRWEYLPGLLTRPMNGDFYRPVQMLLYFGLYQAFGPWPLAFHALNIALQAANACLVYLLGCRLGFDKRAAFAGALLWAVHPLWTEAVTYITGTASLLVAFFFMLGLLSLLPDFTPRKIWHAAIFFLLALGSKESAVVFPAIATFTLFLVSKQRLQLRTYIKTWLLWLIAFAHIALWIITHPGSGDWAIYDYHDDIHTQLYQHNFLNRVYTSLATLPVYLSLLLWPRGQHMDWNFPIVITPLDWQVIGGIFMVVSSLLYIINGRGREGLPFAWGLLWFAAAIAPYTGILKAINGIFEENWIYLATIGLFLGLCDTIAHQIRTKYVPMAAVLLVIAALVLGIKSHIQNEFFKNPVALYENVIKYHPESAQAHYMLGAHYFHEKDFKKAEEEWRTVESFDYDLGKNLVIEMHTDLAMIYLGVPVEPGRGLFLHDVVNALPASRRIPEAIQELKDAVEADPEACCASSLLAAVYYYQGDKKNGDYYKALAEKR